MAATGLVLAAVAPCSSFGNKAFDTVEAVVEPAVAEGTAPDPAAFYTVGDVLVGTASEAFQMALRASLSSDSGF